MDFSKIGSHQDDLKNQYNSQVNFRKSCLRWFFLTVPCLLMAVFLDMFFVMKENLQNSAFSAILAIIILFIVFSFIFYHLQNKEDSIANLYRDLILDHIGGFCNNIVVVISNGLFYLKDNNGIILRTFQINDDGSIVDNSVRIAYNENNLISIMRGYFDSITQKN